MVFQETQVLPKFIDKTSKSAVVSDVDHLLKHHSPSPAQRSSAKRGDNKVTDTQTEIVEVKTSKKLKKYRVQDSQDI